MKKNMNKRGFTFIEFLALVALIFIIGSISWGVYTVTDNDSRTYTQLTYTENGTNVVVEAKDLFVKDNFYQYETYINGGLVIKKCYLPPNTDVTLTRVRHEKHN